jgi:hypothetical protein
MNRSKSRASLKRPGTYLLVAICVVCYATTLAQTGGITTSTIHKETSSGLRVSTPSQADAVEPNSTNQRLDEVAGSFTKDDAFMGAVLVAKGSDILLDKGYGKAVMECPALLSQIIQKRQPPLESSDILAHSRFFASGTQRRQVTPEIPQGWWGKGFFLQPQRPEDFEPE